MCMWEGVWRLTGMGYRARWLLSCDVLLWMHGMIIV